MGRNAGWLTLSSGLASGTDVILIPEIPFDMQKICDFVEERREGDSGFSIIACAEGARAIDGTTVVEKIDPTRADPVHLGGIGSVIANTIEERTGIESRTTTLGHIQRGGEPSASDRVLATTFAAAAIEVAGSGEFNKMVGLQNGHIATMDILSVAHKQRLVPTDHRFISAARSVRTCFGD